MKRGKMKLTSGALENLQNIPGQEMYANYKIVWNALSLSADGNTINEKDVLTNSGAPSGSIADYLNLDGTLSEIRRRAADEAEKHAILKAWQNSSQNLDKAAAELGISRQNTGS